jgi:hypothetical protein
MGTTHRALRKQVALVAAWSLVLSPALPVVGTPHGQVRAAAPQAASAKMAAKTAVAQPDGGWPRSYTTPSGAGLVVYQPQIAAWPNQKHLTLYSAVSYSPKGAEKPVLGTIKAEADTKVSVSERLVDFSVLKITESNFQGLSKEQMQEIVAEINSGIPQDDRVIALDRVLARLDKSQIIPKNVENAKADPPTVFFSQTSAVLVNIDGDPIWSSIANNDLKYAINTNWDVFEYGPTKTLYLRNNDSWLTASTLEGPWGPAGKLPDSFSKLPADDNWKDVKGALPGKKISAKQVPRVFASTKPAEMILLAGAPSYLLVDGTSNLLWVSNTDSDVFRMGKDGPVYYLVTGRWFSAPDFTGPWTFATTSLPEDFKKIPPEHPRSRVLASVPGTDEAAEAVLLAQIPETARVNKDTKAPEVKYDGQPDFKPIEKTTVERAVNTDKDIIKVGDLYYMCFQGVWFMSKAAAGPWEVTGDVPKQIYEIPASSPAYPVTHVTVEQSSSDAVVFATAAAYTGLMVAWGCAVWGTGYYYPPYVRYGGMYPYYHPYYPTYGYSAWYNPWTGTYGRGAAVYGPYGGAGVTARYNPSTGTYARGAAAWGPYGGAAVGQAYNPRTGTYARGGMASGPYGARGAAQAYNPRTGAYGATRQGSNVYGSWGQTGVQRGDQWATTSRYTSNVTGATTRTAQTSEGGEAIRRSGAAGNTFAGQTGSGDVYAGHDGNVYKKDGDSWQKYDNGGWNNVQQPTQQQREQAQQRASQAGAQAQQRASGLDSSTAGQLNRDSAARSEGAQRAGNYGSVRSGGGGNMGSYRPSGGGFRGGGRRR